MDLANAWIFRFIETRTTCLIPQDSSFAGIYVFILFHAIPQFVELIFFSLRPGGKWQWCSMADSSDWETALLCGWVCLAFIIIFAMPFCQFHPKFLELSHCTRASCCKLLWWNNKCNYENRFSKICSQHFSNSVHMKLLSMHSSRRNYTIVIIRGLTNNSLNKLHIVQNHAARVLWGLRVYLHISLVL